MSVHQHDKVTDAWDQQWVQAVEKPPIGDGERNELRDGSRLVWTWWRLRSRPIGGGRGRGAGGSTHILTDNGTIIPDKTRFLLFLVV